MIGYSIAACLMWRLSWIHIFMDVGMDRWIDWSVYWLWGWLLSVITELQSTDWIVICNFVSIQLSSLLLWALLFFDIFFMWWIVSKSLISIFELPLTVKCTKPDNIRIMNVTSRTFSFVWDAPKDRDILKSSLHFLLVITAADTGQNEVPTSVILPCSY